MPRRAVLIFTLATAAVLAGCANAPSAPPPAPADEDPRASVEAFTSWIALSAQGRSREFFVGDHVDGYYSGMTARHRGGPGWFLGPDRVWQDAVAWAAARAAPRCGRRR